MNTATATGYYGTTAYTETDDHSLDVEMPGINVDKSGPASATVGEVVTFTFTVTNTGTVPLSTVTVTDSIAGTATYVSGDANGDSKLDTTETWVYTATWTVAATPDPLVNTATATGTDNSGNSVTGTDTHSTDITMPETYCISGHKYNGTSECVDPLTQGYWKTHSKNGPAPYDDTWALIGEDTPFYKSGQTWYQVITNNKAGGNPYYILASQYTAAKLNVLNGASTTPEVVKAITEAESFFSTYTPDSKLSKSVREQTVALAEILDDYNNGLLTKGQCMTYNQGLAGWTITLKNEAGSVVGTTTTGADGSWQFCNLQNGSYTVCETPQTGWVNLTPLCQPVTINGGDVTSVVFRNKPETPTPNTYCVSGFKYNGTTSEGLVGWTVTLKNQAGTVVGTTVTGTGGSWQFCNLQNGSYTVCETPQSGWVNLTPVCQPVTINGGDLTSVVFRNKPETPTPNTYCVSGFKYNGTTTEGLVGWTVTLKNQAGSVVGTTVTGTGGSWQFCNLQNGSYTVCETPQSGWVNLTPVCQPVTINGGDVTSVVFRNKPETPTPDTYCVSGYKYGTIDCTGTYTQGYWKTHSMNGPAPYDDTWALVTPYEEDTPFFNSGQSWYTVINTEKTGGNAYYILAVQYIAAELNVLRGASTTPDVNAALADAETFFNTYTPDSQLPGQTRADAIQIAEILDDYNNGLLGPGHCDDTSSEGTEGLSGWTITVQNQAGQIVGTDMTDTTGFWEICGLPNGSYTVCETPQSGWVNLTPLCQPVTINGGDVTSVVFRNKPETPTPDTYCISGYKYNGTTNEGLVGWTVTLKNQAGTVVGTTVTGTGGSWQFCNLQNGTYTVCETPQSGWVNLTPVCQPVTVNGASVTSVEFRNKPETPTPDTYCVSGFKYNGTTNEGLVGWTVTLKNQAGTVVGTTVTGTGGSWQFCNLQNGSYTVCETPQSGWVNLTPVCQSVTVNGASVTSVEFRNKPETPTPNTYCVSGFKYNGTTTEGLVGWTVTLKNQAGTVVGTTVTGTDGSWEFCNLQNGSYTACETPQSGWVNLTPVCQSVTVNGASVTSVEFRNKPETPTPNTYCVSGFKYNGTTTEGLVGWTITLKNEAGSVVGTTTTGADGSWEFCNLQNGSYTACETPQSGWVNLTPVCQPVTVNGVDITSIVFRNEPETIPGKGTISGSKFCEDCTEVGCGLPGWTMTLYYESNGTVYKSVITGSGGEYQFEDVPFGTYWLNETMQEGWDQVTPNVKVTLNSTHSDLHYDFVNKETTIDCGCLAEASFTYTKEGMTVTLTDTTPGPQPQQYMWLFGDGTMSTQKNPVKTYSEKGNYKVDMNIFYDNCANGTPIWHSASQRIKVP